MYVGLFTYSYPALWAGCVPPTYTSTLKARDSGWEAIFEDEKPVFACCGDMITSSSLPEALGMCPEKCVCTALNHSFLQASRGLANHPH